MNFRILCPKQGKVSLNFSSYVTSVHSLCTLNLKNVLVMCCRTALPVPCPWYWLCRSAAHPSSSMSQSSGSGSPRITATLCKMQQATTIVQTLSGAILTSECNTWNLLFSTTKPVQWCIQSPCALCSRAPPCRSWGQGRELIRKGEQA